MTRKRTTTERGYGTAHQRERARLKPLVDAGHAWCAQPICIYPTRWIQPGTRWALGHNDARTAWIGPVHHACNQLDGARRGGRTTAARRRQHTPRSATVHSRAW